jgi:glucokinase
VTTIGIDVGGTKVLGVVLDDGDAVVAEHRVPTPRGGDAVVAAVAEVAAELRTPDVVGVGAGVPGFVDRSGVLRFAPNLPGVRELPVRARLADATGLPVRVDNDATCALWAEHVLGACADVDDAVLVTLGTGIGGGLLLDGRLARGANGFAGEPGHMVVDHDGLPCVCGRQGCWERYASGSALGRLARELTEGGRGGRLVELAGGDPLAVRGEHVTAAAAEGDPEAVALFALLGDWFAVGLVNLVHILDVACCVIGGGLVEAGPVLLDPVRRSFAARVVAPEHRPPVTIVPAELGERAGAIGAALLARPAGDAGPR